MYSIHVPKAAHTFEVDFAELPEVTQSRVIRYGLTQLLSDATAPVSMKRDKEPLGGSELTKAQGEARKLAEQRLADLVSGTVRKTRVSGGSDPVAREYRKLIVAAIQKSPKFIAATSAFKKADKGFTDLLAEYVAKYTTSPVEKYMDEAKRIVAAQADMSLDLDI